MSKTNNESMQPEVQVPENQAGGGSCLRKSAVTGQQTSLHFPCLSWVEGMLTYRPFSPEQMRKPSILKQSARYPKAFLTRISV